MPFAEFCKSRFSVLFFSLIAVTVCRADEHRFVLTSVQDNVEEESFELSKTNAGPASSAWKIKKTTLHGGKQEGVTFVTLDNGTMIVSVIPTRGMAILDVKDAKTGERVFGWDSPVKEVVNPQHIDLESRGGLGWLEGFNEWMVRCGLEFAGHPGQDKFTTNTGGEAEMDLTLHGKIGNIPASEVELIVQTKPPYRVTLRGEVSERMFYGPKLKLVTELSMLPNSTSLDLNETITNEGAADQEYQVIYHTNFGAPLLQTDARVVIAASDIAPMNDHAAKGIAGYDRYGPPEVNFIEQVYLVTPHANSEGHTSAVLHDAAAARGASISWSTDTLPYLTLWKNTAATEAGYVTGIEPGSGFPFNRRVERHFGRVPQLEPGASRSFQLTFAFLRNAEEVEQAVAEVKKIGAGRSPTIHPKPPENPFAE